MKKLFLFTLIILGPVFSGAQTKKPAPAAKPAVKKESPEFVTSVEGIKEYKLKNGLKVLLIPDPSQSNVVVNIVYNVGSRHEGYGEKGMAHLLEHMLFKSTKNLGDIKKMLSEKGGNANGTTWFDRTNYYEVFPSNEENLRWSLEMEADRMINATILQSDLDKEFSVVRNEFEIGENNPDGVLNERIISTAYLWHNYGNSTIGSKEDIERVKADRLKVFYQKYYQPDNATLIVGGKFDEKKILEYIGQYFSVIPRPARVLEKTYTVEPPQDGERYVELKRNGDVQIVAAAYHTAPYADKDFAAIDALAEILTSNPSGYLYKALIDGQKASSMYSWQPNVRDAGFLYLSVEVPKDKSLDEARKTFLTELDKIATTSYTEQDVNRAKSKLLKGIENIKNNTIGLTINLTEIIGSGDYRLAFLYRDAVEKLTVADIKRVAENYFKPSNRTYGVFIPVKDGDRTRSAEVSDADIEKLTSTYKGKAVEEDAAAFEASIDNVKKNLKINTLASGFKYAFLKKGIKGKKVVAQFRIPVGNLKALSNKSEVASVMASLMKAGTKTQTKEQIQDKLDQTKSQISFGFSGQTMIIGVSTYQEFLPSTMTLLKDLITESVFPDNEFNKTITEKRTGIESYKNDPQNIVFTQINRKTSDYPKDHILYTPSPDEQIVSLNAVTRQQVVDFYTNILGGNHGYGTIVGDVSQADVDKLVGSTFGSWTAKTPYEKVAPQYFATKAGSEKVITPDKENAGVVAATTFKLDRKHPDYPAMTIADEMLGSGGFLTARIPTRLREKEGISYGAGSFINIPYDNDASVWTAYAFFNPTVQEKVDIALKDEIQKALTAGFTAEELKTNVNSWLVGRKTNLGADNFLINLVNGVLYNGNSLDDFTDLETKVKALNVNDVNIILKKYLSVDKLAIIYAGDFNKK